MRMIIQRVKEASVSVDGHVIGQIKHGYLIYVGISTTDTEQTVKKMADKVMKLRVFEDENGKLNHHINHVKGSILVVSQFTLYGDVKGNHRPSFTEAAKPDIAVKLYTYFVELLRTTCLVETGQFQAHMDVSSVNDGPVTIFIEF